VAGSVPLEPGWPDPVPLSFPSFPSFLCLSPPSQAVAASPLCAQPDGARMLAKANLIVVATGAVQGLRAQRGRARFASIVDPAGLHAPRASATAWDGGDRQRKAGKKGKDRGTGFRRSIRSAPATWVSLLRSWDPSNPCPSPSSKLPVSSPIRPSPFPQAGPQHTPPDAFPLLAKATGTEPRLGTHPARAISGWWSPRTGSRLHSFRIS